MAAQPRHGIYELFMLGLCTYVLAALAATTFFRLEPSTAVILEYVDILVCVFFLADFAGKLATARNKLEYLKWGWLDLVSSIPTIGLLRWGRLARVIRVLRLLRGVRSVKTLLEFTARRRADSAVAAAAMAALLMTVFGSIGILHFEQDAKSNIKTPEEALWWAFTTVTTVGYGDLYPVTTEGRILAAGVMIAGVGLFGTFTGFVASWFLAPGEKEQENELESIRRQLGAIESQLRQIAARQAVQGEVREADT